MTLLFYLLLVWLSPNVDFSWIAFFFAIIFSSMETKTVRKYIYINNTDYKKKIIEVENQN